MQENNSSIEKVVILGGGPAGLASALYTSRATLNPLVFAGSPPGGQLTLTTEVENYLGYESVLGPELLTIFRKHSQKFGTRVLDKNVVRVDFSKRPFSLFIADTKGEIETKAQAVILATGAKALWLGLDSETRLRGKGVSACATCDGFFFKNKEVAVIGGGDTALEEALTLTNFASKVYLIHRRDSFRASKIMQERVLHHPKIEVVWNSQIAEVLGQNNVEGVRCLSLTDKSSRDIALSGVFVAIGHKPDTDIFKGQIELDGKGYIHTFARVAEDYLRGMIELDQNKIAAIRTGGMNYSTMTSVAGVFAAGDNVDYQYRQAATAVGMGVEAALDAERWLELSI